MLVTLPIGSVMSSLSAMAMMAVAIDRVVILWNPLSKTKPRFCKQATARLVMTICFVMSVLFNIPFCFIYEWSEDGKLVTTQFYNSV